MRADATYAGWHPDLLRLYPYSDRWYKWALYDRDPLERWSKERVMLLGDSAHAMLPYLGHGAAMAIEDACVLSAAIARHADVPDQALLAYERLRVPRARAAVLGARERARENHLASPWERLKRDVKFALSERFGGDKTVFQTDSVALWLWCRARAVLISIGPIHLGDSQIARSSPSSRYESKDCGERHAGSSGEDSHAEGPFRIYRYYRNDSGHPVCRCATAPQDRRSDVVFGPIC